MTPTPDTEEVEDVEETEEPELTETEELQHMEEFRNEIYKATGFLAQAAQEPLTFEPWEEPQRLQHLKAIVDKLNGDAYTGQKAERLRRAKLELAVMRNQVCQDEPVKVATGILWIPNFVSLDWIPVQKRIKKPKCCCPACGSKHAKKGG